MPEKKREQEVRRLIEDVQRQIGKRKGKNRSGVRAVVELMNTTPAAENFHFTEYLVRNAMRPDAVEPDDLARVVAALYSILGVEAVHDRTEAIEEQENAQHAVTGLPPGFPPIATFKPDNLDDWAETLEGLWRLCYLRPSQNEGGNPVHLVHCNVMFVRKLTSFYCEATMIVQTRIFKGVLYISEHHMYVLFHDTTKRAESAFLITNRPVRVDPTIVGLVLVLERAEDSEQPIRPRPVLSTMAFGRKLEGPEDIPGDEPLSEKLKPACDRILAGELRTDDVKVVRDVCRKGYLHPEDYLRSEHDLSKSLRGFKVNGAEIADMSAFFGSPILKIS